MPLGNGRIAPGPRSAGEAEALPSAAVPVGSFQGGQCRWENRPLSGDEVASSLLEPVA